jgi:hypothetical protein
MGISETMALKRNKIDIKAIGPSTGRRATEVVLSASSIADISDQVGP